VVFLTEQVAAGLAGRKGLVLRGLLSSRLLVAARLAVLLVPRTGFLGPVTQRGALPTALERLFLVERSRFINRISSHVGHLPVVPRHWLFLMLGSSNVGLTVSENSASGLRFYK